MPELFHSQPIRPPARRGGRSMPMRRPAHDDLWPRPSRDAADVAIVAGRLLVAAGRFSTRVHALARRHGVDPLQVRLLLLFAESDRPLRIGNVAEFLGVSHSTASRAAARGTCGRPDRQVRNIDRQARGDGAHHRRRANGREPVSRRAAIGRSRRVRSYAVHHRPSAGKGAVQPARSPAEASIHERQLRMAGGSARRHA